MSQLFSDPALHESLSGTHFYTELLIVVSLSGSKFRKNTLQTVAAASCFRAPSASAMDEATGTLEDGTIELVTQTRSSFMLKEAEYISIIHPSGQQVANLLVYSAGNTRETLSNGWSLELKL